jgi:hypothetical protein
MCHAKLAVNWCISNWAYLIRIAAVDVCGTVVTILVQIHVSSALKVCALFVNYDSCF